MHQFIIFGMSACLAALAGCSEEPLEQAAGGDAGAPALLSAEPSPDAPTLGSLGPIQYGFAPQSLARAEIQLALPPEYDKTVWATKFITVEQAALLGSDTCSDSSDGPPRACTVEHEDGLAMALLERPIADYRRSFHDGGIPDSALGADRLAGAAGFCFTAQVTGSGMDYCYYRVDERTLLVARRYDERGAPLDAASRDVLDTLRIPA